jgi:hypothetical protein
MPACRLFSMATIRSIGWRQLFSFMTKEASQRVRNTRTGWIMVEISLDKRNPRTSSSCAHANVQRSVPWNRPRDSCVIYGAATPVLMLETIGAKESTLKTALNVRGKPASLPAPRPVTATLSRCLAPMITPNHRRARAGSRLGRLLVSTAAACLSPCRRAGSCLGS